MSGMERGQLCFLDPMVSDDEGLELFAYEPASDEICLTEDGEEVCNLSVLQPTTNILS